MPNEAEERGFTLRAIIVGLVLSFFIGAGDVYNQMLIHGSYMTIDFTTAGAIFFIFWLSLFNLLLKRFFPRSSLSGPEMILIYMMMVVACAIPTMGLTFYLVPLISGVKYYATPQNEWGTLLIPHIKNWLILQDENAVRWFYEGLPPGQGIPWLTWVKPLSFWLSLILVLYLVMTFIMVLLRKQWVERERLNYPLIKAPLELIHSTTNKLFQNKIFWLGLLVPLLIGCINGIHFYQPLFPNLQLSTSLPFFRGTLKIPFLLSFPMIGFTYFVNLSLSFSLWFFCLLTTAEQGFFNITGFGRNEFLPYNADRPMLGWQSLGALLVIVLYGLWVSRHHLSGVCKRALRRGGEEDKDEIISLPVAFWGTVLGILFIFLWLVMSGLSPLPSLIFLFFALLVFIGITRVIVEGGLAATRAPVIAPVTTNSLLGTSHLGPGNLASLGLTFIYASDVRTFVMASVANGLKMLEEVKKRKKVVFWAIVLAMVISLISSIWATLVLGYKHGAINADPWFFVHGPQYPWDYIVEKIKNPTGVDWIYLGFMGIGAVFTILLQFMKTRFFWFPLHPLGFAFSTIGMTNALWFSIFIAWLVKALILRYGGPRAYEQSKLLFIGLIVGQFVVNGIWLIIDFFTGQTGNMLFWA
ncbi:MAG: DUF6785 family protein [Candidatus Zixiibacteriota bacterium]